MFRKAALSQPNPCRHKPEDGGCGGKGFRKNFECQFHARFPRRVALVGEQPALIKVSSAATTAKKTIAIASAQRFLGVLG
jgi:hypothetical protein